VRDSHKPLILIAIYRSKSSESKRKRERKCIHALVGILHGKRRKVQLFGGAKF